MKKIKFFTIIFTVIFFYYTIINSVEHIVVKGDCLWNISKFYYKNPFLWKKIYQANKDKISNPNLIYPGQKFFIPDIEINGGKILQTKITEDDRIKNEFQLEEKEQTQLQNKNLIEEDFIDQLQTINKEDLITQNQQRLEKIKEVFAKKIKYEKSKIIAIIESAKEEKFFYIDFDIVYCKIENNNFIKKDEILGIYHLGPSQYNTSLTDAPEDELNLVGIMKIKEIDEKNSIITAEILRCYSPITIGDLIIK